MTTSRTNIIVVSLASLAVTLGACSEPRQEPTTSIAESALGDEPNGMPNDSTPLRRSGVYRTPKPQGASPVEAPMTITTAQLAAQITTSGALSAFAEANQINYSHAGIATAGAGAIAAITGETATITANTASQLIGTTPSYTFDLDRSRGVLSIHHRTRGFTDDNPADVGATAIMAIALEDLAVLGLTPQTGAAVDVKPLQRTRVGHPNDVRKLAYKVFVRLDLHGLGVDGPNAIFSYYLDGTLHKVVVAWPAIRTDPAVLSSPVTAPSAATAAIAKLTGHPLGSITTPLTIAPGLIVHGDVLRRALFVSGWLANPRGDDRRGELIIPL